MLTISQLALAEPVEADANQFTGSQLALAEPVEADANQFTGSQLALAEPVEANANQFTGAGSIVRILVDLSLSGQCNVEAFKKLYV